MRLVLGLLLLTSAVLAADDGARLLKLFADDYAWQLREYPEFATSQGAPGGNDRWTDWSLDAIERRRQHPRENLRVLETIHADALLRDDQLNYSLFRRKTLQDIERDRFPGELLHMDPLFEGVHRDSISFLLKNPRNTVKDYEDILARLRALPALIEQSVALLQRGVERHVTQPRVVMRDVPAQIDSILAHSLADSPLMQPFGKFPLGIPAAEQARLRRAAAAEVDGRVSPSLRRLRDYLLRDYIPNCRESIAVSALPNGKAWYEFRAREMTTTNLTAQQIHDIGIREVARIREAMLATIQQTGFKGDFAAFVHFLRTDPQFYFTRAGDLVMAYRDLCKRIDPELPRLFGKLPRTPYGVEPIPAHVAPSETTARYEPGAADGSRAGMYVVNTYKLDSRPKYEMEALSLHESVPGHHLQFALAQELENLPRFRKDAYIIAFSEGWGLYAESLGLELGLYQDPYSRFGQLSYEMWRACRLVVDTGMHAMGWSRQRAIDYMKANTALTEQNIVVEVDRYIANPAQALGYKIGELKIRELRTKAERELGPKFRIREFHDLVLSGGSIPLDVLEARVNAYIAAAGVK